MDSVYIPIPISTVKQAPEPPSKTYRLDLEAGRIVGVIDGIDAVEQAIRKALITPRFACLIYDAQYGDEIQQAFIWDDATRDYMAASAEAYVRDALLPDTRVISVSDFNIEFEDDAANIEFTANTVFGVVQISEVVMRV